MPLYIEAIAIKKQHVEQVKSLDGYKKLIAEPETEFGVVLFKEAYSEDGDLLLLINPNRGPFSPTELASAVDESDFLYVAVDDEGGFSLEGKWSNSPFSIDVISSDDLDESICVEPSLTCLCGDEEFGAANSAGGWAQINAPPPLLDFCNPEEPPFSGNEHQTLGKSIFFGDGPSGAGWYWKDSEASEEIPDWYKGNPDHWACVPVRKSDMDPTPSEQYAQEMKARLKAKFKNK